MSFNRENVIWKSSTDGRWYMGFYTVTWTGYESDGYDPEWDCEYDFSSFEWVSGPHLDKESAWQSWHGRNPGGGTIVSDGDTSDLDKMFKEARKARSK